MDMTNLAEATAAHLGGVAGIGVEVGSDADLARAVAAGFNVKAIDALRQSGVTGGDLGTLVIKPRTLSHRRTNGGRLTVDESDRAARVARGLALAERTFANRDKAARWLPRCPRRPHADGPDPHRCRLVSSRVCWREFPGARQPDAALAARGDGIRGAQG